MIDTNLFNQDTEKLAAELSDAHAQALHDELVAEINRQGLVKTGLLRDTIEVKEQQRSPTNYIHEIWMQYYGEYLNEGTPTISPRAFVQRAMRNTIRKDPI